MRRVSCAIGSSTSKASTIPVRLRYLFLFATVIGGSLLTFCVNSNIDILISNNEAISPRRLQQYDVKSPRESFTIKTEGCSIPALKPFDESIKTFVEFPKNMEPCPNSMMPLLSSNLTHIWVRHENKKHYNVSFDSNNYTCCYKSFYRPVYIEDIMSTKVDDRVQYSGCTYFSDVIEAKDEFVRVICSNDEQELYQQFFLFAMKKKFESHGTDELASNNTSYNVIVMGIDAVSRLNFHRTMPKTAALLKNIQAVELLGYNKVGDNTFPNVIPMLMGIKDTELKPTCLPNEHSTFDNCPFVWEWYKQAGYYTALAEDNANIGTFNYIKVGFSGTPTDYYLHTFFYEAENNVGKNKDFNCYLCMNEKYFYKVLLDYIENLFKTLSSTKLFGFFWEVTMSHDYLNYPMVMDEDYETFFKNLDSFDYLEETVLFLVSDHGIRWGDIRSTKQGRLEERLPFVYILVPRSFREKYNEAYNNLKLNKHRLTTPFDVHATLEDLINLENIENEMIKSRTNKLYATERSISLFLPIPRNRTCQLAGIDDHWCTCHKGHKLSPLSRESVQASTELVRHINMLLKEYTQCARLKLAEVIEVSEMEVGTPDKDEKGWREFMIVMRTIPGDAIFEATIRENSNSDWFLAGSVSRLNLYGDQSHCIHNYQLKLYCYCV